MRVTRTITHLRGGQFVDGDPREQLKRLVVEWNVRLRLLLMVAENAFDDA